jgi:hypothetical protein
MGDCIYANNKGWLVAAWRIDDKTVRLSDDDSVCEVDGKESKIFDNVSEATQWISTCDVKDSIPRDSLLNLTEEILDSLEHLNRCHVDFWALESKIADFRERLKNERETRSN